MATWKVLILAFLVGASMPLGALLYTNQTVRAFCIKYQLDCFMAALGGGALLAAIALIFVPTGMARFSMLQASGIFLMGGILAWRISVIQEARNSPTSQFLSMFLDFIPESLALGAAPSMGEDTVYLIAGLAAVQNLPQGFSSYHEMLRSRMNLKKIKLLFLFITLLGPIFAGIGLTVLAMNSTLVPLLMLFSGGAIVYFIFQDIAPNARLRTHHLPALGSVIGFMVGIIGCMMIDH